MVDRPGNLWLLGGYDGNLYTKCDLWMLNTTSMQWSWMAGIKGFFSRATYQTQGVDFDAEGRTAWGARVDGALFYSAHDGCIYIWAGYDSSFVKNDMWRYNPVTDKIAWLHGSSLDSTSAGSASRYPTTPDGLYNAINLPYPRTTFGYASDSARGLFYILGGLATSGTASDLANDVWVFNSTAVQWAWPKGTKTQLTYDSNAYGSFRAPAAGNLWTGRRRQASAIDAVGGFIYQYAGINSAGAGMSDVGRFDIATRWWSWWGGSKNANREGAIPPSAAVLSTPTVRVSGTRRRGWIRAEACGTDSEPATTSSGTFPPMCRPYCSLSLRLQCRRSTPTSLPSPCAPARRATTL